MSEPANDAAPLVPWGGLIRDMGLTSDSLADVEIAAILNGCGSNKEQAGPGSNLWWVMEDREWFSNHPDRRHRLRPTHADEDKGPGKMALRWLGEGQILAVHFSPEYEIADTEEAIAAAIDSIMACLGLKRSEAEGRNE